MAGNDVSLSAGTLDEASSGLTEVAAEFADELGGPPTLAEFLELLGWAIPVNSDATDCTFIAPMKFKATLKGNKPYRSDAQSRVSDLNDHFFVETAYHLQALANRMSAASGAPVTPQQLATAVLHVLRSGRIPLAHIEPQNLCKLIADVPKKRFPRPNPGDVLAIPARKGGYYPAVVLTQNSFGTALGLFHGVSPSGRLTTALRAAPRKYPIYTGDDLVRNGTWRVVAHDDSLRDLFPADPPIYHYPDPDRVDRGTFGIAETADGTVRLIGPDEAREIGLQGGTYRQTFMDETLQAVLDIEADQSDAG